MPSLRSNKNKKGIPTLPVPATSVCIPVNVPDDPRWIALFLGAIYQLSQQIWYDRDAEHSAKIVADKWRDIYLQTVKAAWDCSGMFDLRIDPLDECSIQKTNDGETWVEVFRLDTRCAIANVIRNPYTGTLGYWDDLDFYTIPDGPWTPSMYPEFSSNPPPIAGVDKDCLAATTAAHVLRNLYKTVADTLLDVVGATDWDYASSLGLALQGFLMLIGAAAMQVYVSIASLLGIVGVRQQYIDYPLDNDDEERLKCILLEHATEHSGGSVTFDFQGVWDSIDLDSPKNGLVRFLLTMIGPDALNYAGAVQAGLAADCDSCVPSECVSFNESFTSGIPANMFIADNTWPVLNTTHDTRNNGGWSGSAGRAALGCVIGTNDPDSVLPIRQDLIIDLQTSCTVDSFRFWYLNSGPGSAAWYVVMYDELRNEIFGPVEFGNVTGWTRRLYTANQENVRYIRVACASNYGNRVDDIEVLLDP